MIVMSIYYVPDDYNDDVETNIMQCWRGRRVDTEEQRVAFGHCQVAEWEGRLQWKRDTCTIVNVKVNVVQADNDISTIALQRKKVALWWTKKPLMKMTITSSRGPPPITFQLGILLSQDFPHRLKSLKGRRRGPPEKDEGSSWKLGGPWNLKNETKTKSKVAEGQGANT